MGRGEPSSIRLRMAAGSRQVRRCCWRSARARSCSGDRGRGRAAGCPLLQALADQYFKTIQRLAPLT